MVSVPSDHTGAIAAGFPTDRRWQAAARHAAAPANFVADVVAAASVSSVAMSIHEATMSMVDARSEDEQVQHGAAGPGAGRLVE